MYDSANLLVRSPGQLYVGRELTVDHATPKAGPAHSKNHLPLAPLPAISYMYTFLSQLDTARKSFVGENIKSDMLSVGRSLWGTSTSLLISPVVEGAAVLAALPNNPAIAALRSSVCGR